MKQIFLYLILLNTASLSWSNAPTHELTASFWNSPSFVRSFMGDYGFRSEIEPKISKHEKLIIQEVVAKAENRLEEAIAYLEKKTDVKSSAALDFSLATMYYQHGRLTRSEESYKNALRRLQEGFPGGIAP